MWRGTSRMKISNSGLVEQDTGFEPAPSVWKTDMLAANTNPANILNPGASGPRCSSHII